jgi:hypothetical protein
LIQLNRTNECKTNAVALNEIIGILEQIRIKGISFIKPCVSNYGDLAAILIASPLAAQRS